MRLAYRSVLCALFFACSSDSDVSVPPAPPEAGATSSQDTMTFAIDSIQLGDSLNGVLDSTAWKSLGYNLDGKETTSASTDVCTLAPDALQSSQVDGYHGRDNAFGSNVAPILQTVIQPICFFNCDPNAPPLVLSVEATKDISHGRFTLQIVVTGLNTLRDQTATGLTAQVFTSDAFDADGGTIPAFNGSTDWPVQSESVIDSLNVASGAKAAFSKAYVVNGTFVAGTNEHVDVALHARYIGLPVTFTIHSAIITFEHVDNEALDGVIAGVLDTEEFVDVFRRISGLVSATLCGAAFDGIATQLRAAADILLDRTNTPGTPCTGISIGLAFHATAIANPTRVAPPLVEADRCPTDAGANDASDAN